MSEPLVATATVPVYEHPDLAPYPVHWHALHNAILKDSQVRVRTHDFCLDFAKQLSFNQESLLLFWKLLDIGPRNNLSPEENFVLMFPDMDVFLSLLFPDSYPQEFVENGRLLAANLFPTDTAHLMGFMDRLSRTWAHALKGADIVDFVIERWPQFTFTCLVAKRLRELSDAKIIFSGGAVSVPEKATVALTLGACDFVLAPDADVALPRLVKALTSGQDTREINNVFSADGNGSIVLPKASSNLVPYVEVPFPDFSDFPMEEYPRDSLGRKRIDVKTSRGCGHRCRYCVARKYWAPDGLVFDTLRLRSPDLVATYLEGLEQKYHIDHVQFSDNEVTTSGPWLDGFLKSLGERSIDFTWEGCARFDSLSPPVIERLRRSGCDYLVFGAESLDSHVLEEMGRTDDVQRYISTLPSIVKKTLDEGIRVQLNVICGHPQETDDEFITTFRRLEALRRQMDAAGYPVTFPSDPYYLTYGSEDYTRFLSDPAFEVTYWPQPEVSTGIRALDKALSKMPYKLRRVSPPLKRSISSFAKSWLTFSLSTPESDFATKNFIFRAWARQPKGNSMFERLWYALEREPQPLLVDDQPRMGYRFDGRSLLLSEDERRLITSLASGPRTFRDLLSTLEGKERSQNPGNDSDVEEVLRRFLKEGLSFGIVKALTSSPPVH